MTHKQKLFVRFVIFHNEVLAVFMRNTSERRYANSGSGFSWVRGCYAHNGQHGECYDGMHNRKQATKEEYAPLAQELKSLGYELTIMNKDK